MPLSHYRCATWFSGIAHTMHIYTTSAFYQQIRIISHTHTHSQTVVFRVIYKVQKCSPSTTGASTMVATANVRPGDSEIMKHQFRMPPLWPLIGIVFRYTADRYRCWIPAFLEAARYISWLRCSPANEETHQTKKFYEEHNSSAIIENEIGQHGPRTWWVMCAIG